MFLNILLAVVVAKVFFGTVTGVREVAIVVCSHWRREVVIEIVIVAWSYWRTQLAEA